MKSQSQPLFSILIANFNNSCYIQETIESIFKQSYKNWEIIIVDDGSTDEPSIVYETLLRKDPRIHIFYNNTNKGVGFTKNKCISLASGEICGFIDPDDILADDDAIKEMVETHIEHKNASLVYSGMFRADDNLKILNEAPGKDIDPDSSALKSKSWPIHHFATFKKSAYLKTDGIDPLMRRAVDYDLYYKLEEVGEIIHLDAFHYIQRNNPHSISLNNNSYKAAAWHSYACAKAMQRRGLTDESLMLFPIEHALRKEFQKGYEEAQSSKIYRFGYFFAKPVLFFMKITGSILFRHQKED